MKTTEATERFIAARRAQNVSRRTMESYHYRFGRFAKVLPELPTAPEPIERFLCAQGPSDETRLTYYCTIHALYRWLQVRKLIRRNPMAMIDKPRVTRKVAKSLPVEELGRLLGATHVSPHCKAMVLLLIDTGIRLSEALSLTAESFLDGLIVVDGKTGQRFVPISAEVAFTVRAVLPWPWAHYQTASKAIRRARKRVGITGRRKSAHALRHTFVRMWSGDPFLLVGICGWTSPRMLQVYRPYDVARASKEHSEHSPLARMRRLIP